MTKHEEATELAPGTTLSIIFAADFRGPVAQLDRASHYGCEGLGFDSLRVHKSRKRRKALFAFVDPYRCQGGLFLHTA